MVRNHPDLFGIEVLTAHSNCEMLIRQAVEFLPNAVVIGTESCFGKVREALRDYPVKVFAGESAIAQVVEMEGIDLVLSAMVGYAGLRPTLAAIRAGKDVALANKEALVVAGELLVAEASRSRSRIIPVDSEHSAIFQCLEGENPASVEKIILTASGGPFFGKGLDELRHITCTEALCHPNWTMGRKITIDSATLMNKGLEMIEAHWLFGVPPGRIEVVVHPQSVVHSMVQFTDGSVKAQLGVPDMRLPILYALGHPARVPSGLPRLDFATEMTLTFQPPDVTVFKALSLAYEALGRKGTMPCVLNAANEVAVHAFLENRIGFLSIPEVIESCMARAEFIREPGYDDYVSTHRDSVARAREIISKM